MYTYDNLCKVKINNKILTSKIGKLYAISPSVIHHEIVDDSFSRYVAIMIDQDFFNSICLKYKIKDFQPFECKEFNSPPSLTMLIRDFIIETENKLPGHNELVDAIGLRICHTLVRLLFKISDSIQKVSSRMDIEEVIRYMNTHYQKNITIDDLATVMHRSNSAFMRIFKHETGISPGEFLIQIRLERARKLLLATDQSVTDIAFNCGFNSSSHFATTFLKKYKINPSNYKKYHKAQIASS
jgi:AraC-like DNA-binding protein